MSVINDESTIKRPVTLDLKNKRNFREKKTDENRNQIMINSTEYFGFNK